MRSLSKKTLLNAGDSGATFPGTEFQVEQAKGWTYVFTTSVAGAATLDIEAYLGGAWHVVHSQDLSATGSFMVRDDHGHYEKIRVNGSITGGTHTVIANGTVDSL
jgi:hypothetical protein